MGRRQLRWSVAAPGRMSRGVEDLQRHGRHLRRSPGGVRGVGLLRKAAEVRRAERLDFVWPQRVSLGFRVAVAGAEPACTHHVKDARVLSRRESSRASRGSPLFGLTLKRLRVFQQSDYLSVVLGHRALVAPWIVGLAPSSACIVEGEPSVVWRTIQGIVMPQVALPARRGGVCAAVVAVLLCLPSEFNSRNCRAWPESCDLLAGCCSCCLCSSPVNHVSKHGVFGDPTCSLHARLNIQDCR